MKEKTGLRQIVMCFLALLLLMMGALPAHAAQTGSISVTLEDQKNQKLVTGGELTLYQVAALVIGDGKAGYEYVNGFEGCGISLDDLSDSGLAQKLAEKRTSGTRGTAKTIDEQGHVSYPDLEQGLYLLVQTRKSDGYETIRPFLVSLPMETEYGWDYEIDASPKVEAFTPTTPDTPGKPSHSGHSDHPGTPTTPEKPSGGSEKSGRQDVYPIHEVLIPWHSGGFLTTLPQTGQLNWPVPVLSILGLVLFSVGWMLRKEDNRE